MGDRTSSPNKPNEKRGWEHTLSSAGWEPVASITEKTIRQISAYAADLTTEFRIRFYSSDANGIRILGNIAYSSGWMADVLSIGGVWVKGTSGKTIIGDLTV